MSKKFWSASELETGEYTPTATLITNLVSVTTGVLTYQRVGDVVSVFGYVNVDATAAGFVDFTLPLPLPSNMTNFTDLSGSLTNHTGDRLRVMADSTNDVAKCEGSCADTATRTYTLVMMYKLK